MNDRIALLIRGAEIFAPEPLGRLDVLCAGRRIMAIGEALTMPSKAGRVVDADGLRLVPGLIDGHVHIAACGGEGVLSTRNQEMPLSWMIEAGITSVVGLLEAGGAARNLDNLLMKAKSIRAQGLSAWIWTGSPRLPVTTLTGGVTRDLTIVDEVIGVGAVAIAEHGASTPTAMNLVRLANQARLGAMLGGKCGLTHIDLGDGEHPFDLLRRAVAESELRPMQFYPTHVNRNAGCFEDAKDWGREGYVDITAAGWEQFQDDEIEPSRAIRELLDAGVPVDHITMTSDAGGSLPEFDGEGNLVRLHNSRLDGLWRETVAAIADGLPPEQALAVVTRNPARILRLPGKGRIAVGADADLVLVDDAWAIEAVIAGGEVVFENGEVTRRGALE